MKFENESTYKKFIESGNEGEFDRLFDNALDVARRKFGSEYPMKIGKQDVKSSELIIEASPIDRKIIMGKFQKGTRQDAQLAIRAAKDAFDEWSQTDYYDRADIFTRAASLLSERKFEIASVLSYENGKSRYESIGEVDEGIDFLRYYSLELIRNKGFLRRNKIGGASKHANAGFQGSPSFGERITIKLRPYGVFGVIAPFNFPISISIGMSSGAMLAGNSVVFKPSSTDNMAMMSGYKIYELFADAGLPPGVFNYITGPGSTVGDELAINPDVAGIAFTGSRQVGTNMIKKSMSSNQYKQFIVEMGGKNPAIVMKNADLERAASGVASAAFGYAGQKCSALSRLYVHESIKERFVGMLIDKARNMKIGNPTQKDIYIGPLISAAAYERYLDVVRKAKAQAHILYGGNVIKTGLDGFYVEPMIIEAAHDSDFVSTELFLPVLTVEEFSDLGEAIKLANDSEYGLTAGFYGKKRSDIERFANAIESGVVYINRASSATTGAIVGSHTFVGWKGSGISGKGTGSIHYLQQFTREQSVSISE